MIKIIDGLKTIQLKEYTLVFVNDVWYRIRLTEKTAKVPWIWSREFNKSISL